MHTAAPDWTIQNVPAKLEDALGIRGGLGVQVTGTGKVTATMDSASASVTMNVGDVHIIANRAAVRALELESQVDGPSSRCTA